MGPLLQPYQEEEELTHPIFSPPLPQPPSLCLSVSVSLLVGRGAALPAGVLEGGPGAKAGEGEGRGAAQGWHGDPRPHPELCGKVSGGVWRWGADGSLSGRDSCQCLFCSTTCVYRSAGGGD